MSHNTKIILIIVGVFLLTCILACVALSILVPQWGQNFIQQAQDPTTIQKTASEIADFTLPPGYRGFAGFDFFGTKMVMFAQTGDATSLIMLMQVAQREVDRAQLEQQMQQQLERRSSGSCTNNQVVGQETLNVKGSPTLFVISECTQRGVRMRQVIGAFQGKGGLAIVMGIGPASGWDQAAFRKFLESIR